MPWERWERASVHPFNFLLEFQMSDFGREALSSRHSMWERLSGEQQHSHTHSVTVCWQLGSPGLCTFTSTSFNPSWHVSDGRGCF